MPSAPLVYCPHCDNEVAERTYRRHKAVYYNSATSTWETEEEEYVDEPVSKKARDNQQKDCFLPKWPDGNANCFLSNQSDGNVNSSYAEEETVSADTLQTVAEPPNVECIQLDPVANFLGGKIEEIWEDVTEEDIIHDIKSTADTKYRTEDDLRQQPLHLSTIARWTILFISSWTACFNISANAICYLLRFLHVFLVACGIFVPNLNVLSKIIPKSSYHLRMSQGCLEDNFIKYAVCPSCDSIYKLSDCKDIKVCTFVQFPNHPQRKFRERCGTELFKEITLQNGNVQKYPIKTFCYRPIKDSLCSFLNRTGFQKNCESWRNRTIIPGLLRDVYDGRIWKSFMKYNNKPFLELPRRYGLLLNVDWFQPYKHSPYSTGGIYFSLMNLPRNERYKQENIIVAAVIPGPHEPSKSINSYLRPIVDELVELWEDGFKHRGRDDQKEEDYYAALLCCSCDVPATRKVCGFLGHSAKVGCSKCLKNFKTGKFGEKMDYGGFSNIYEQRKDHEHRKIAKEILKQPTKSATETLEQQHGVRYTELMRLKYFNCITFSVIDPMHNLFQGTSKYMFKTIWADKLSKESLHQIQDLVDNMTVPTSLGRIPRKIESSFASFTSDQWKNWTLYFSAIALKNHLPKKDYDCWLIFVEACRILCNPTVTVQQLKKGHERIMKFCRTFEQLYGSNAATPNMHLHTHLVQCILDYGPFHGFWLFGFERMNGILGSFNTNKRSPEMQFMRKILQTQQIHALQKPTYLAELFAQAFEFETHTETESSSAETVQNLIALSTGTVNVDTAWIRDVGIQFIGSRHDACITEHYLDFLKRSVSNFLDTDLTTITGSCSKYFAIEMCGEKYGSSNSRLSRSSVVLASWCSRGGEINTSGTDVRPGIIRFFITFFININGEPRRLNFAFVHWFQKIPYDYCPLVSLWCRCLFEPEGPASFIPVQRIDGKAICALVRIKNETVLAVIPHLRHFYF